MKSLNELHKISNALEVERNKILDEIFHHPEFIAHYFEKLNLKDDHKYLNNLTSSLDVVHSGWYYHTYSISGKHYLVKEHHYDGHFADIIFYLDGKKENDRNENNYKKYTPNQYKSLLRIMKIYFSNKCNTQILNELLEKEKLEDFVVIGFLLFLNNFVKK